MGRMPPRLVLIADTGGSGLERSVAAHPAGSNRPSLQVCVDAKRDHPAAVNGFCGGEPDDVA